jgi:FkbM family methyltransferase
VPWQGQLEATLAENVFSARERERQAFDRVTGPWAESIVLYGAGNLGRKVLAGLRKHNIEPLAFADGNPLLHGKQVDGVPVFAPGAAALRFRRDAVFVVCVWHPHREHGVQDIINRLSGMGIERVTSFVPLFWKFAEDFLPYYLWDLPSKLLAEKAAIWETYEALETESREQLAAELRLRLHGDFGAMAPPLRTPQYFANELFAISDAECFVDCGAYDGDTMRDFVSAVDGRFRKLIAFEADSRNFQRLSAYVEEQPRAVNERISIREIAVGRTSGVLRFASTAGSDAAVSATGDTVIAATTLDEALADDVPTIVKMDIEGSEIDALEGGSRVIATHQPLLAICLYHRPDHLWAIPLWLKKAEPEARLFLKSYAVDGWESVCFAVPQNRCIVGDTLAA